MDETRFAGCLAVLAIGSAAACGRNSADSAAKNSAAPGRLVFGAATVVSDSGAGYVTSMAALSPTGLHAYVWVASQPDGGTLHVRTDSAGSQGLPDPEGNAGGDPETPPKVAFGRGGEIYIVYQIVKQLGAGQDPLAPEWRAGQRSSLRVIRSEDAGKTWSPPSNIADDGLWAAYRSDHAFHVSTAGDLFAAWIDGRDPKRERIYLARSSDRGTSWSKNTPIDMELPCECCRMAIASSTDGRVYVAWRKVLPGGLRDIVVASSSDSGSTWSAPVLAHADNWKIDGCPDAGPSMVAAANGRLHLAWWTGKEGAAGVRYVSSPDGGKTWGTPVPLKVGEASKPSHVQIALGPDGALYVVWEDGLSNESPILLAVSHNDGASFEAPVPVTEPGNSGGYPAVAVAPMGLSVVWHRPDPTAKNARQVVARAATLH